MADDIDPLDDPITQDLIGFLTGIIEMRNDDGALEDESLVEAVGTLAAHLMPSSFTISGQMSGKELGRRISSELSGHMLRLVASFGYLFAELAEANDREQDTKTADLLREISLEIRRRNDGS